MSALGLGSNGKCKPVVDELKSCESWGVSQLLCVGLHQGFRVTAFLLQQN